MRAINSVFAQSVRDYELIIINDGSTDKGPDSVRTVSSPNIRLIDQPNSGVSAARNRGIREAKADLIVFLDADDEWTPDFLETIVRLQKTFTSCSVYATAYLFCRHGGFRYNPIVRLPDNFEEGILEDYFSIAFQSDPPLWTSAVAVSREAIQSVGGFPAGVTSGEDLLTWARLASKFNIAYSKHRGAFHFNPLQVSERPGRIPQQPDFVGAELANLLQTGEPSKIKGLKKYIALWHRMRAVTYLHLGEKRKAIEEIRKALDYSFDLKLLVLFALSLLPSRAMKNLYILRNFIKQMRPLKTGR